MNALTILALGFLLGLKHATDADHVMAVTTIVSRQRKLRHAAMVGITWGIGHTLMIIVVGIAIILFHVSIPVKLQLVFEFIVAIALVILGVLNLTGIMQKVFSAYSEIRVFHLFRPLIVGLIHGLAGSAAIALLVLSSINNQNLALLYLGIFGVGTIMGMMLITTLLGGAIITGSRRFARFDRAVTIITGLVSISYGLYFGYTIGFVEGLFR